MRPMATVQCWTGAETKVLRQAMRLSIRAFAAHLGVDARTVNKWEARGSTITLLPDTQALMDTALDRAPDDVKSRFTQTLDSSATVASQEQSDGFTDALASLTLLGGTAAPIPCYADAAYLEAVQQHIRHIVELDGRFGGADLARLAVSFFRSVHQRLGAGAYELAIERDLQATAGELAEVAGWLLYDAARQGDVRRMNQEALYFSRLSGDRTMELLTLQNVSMHAGFLGRPREALHVARSVLESRDRLSPRIKTLFLVRKARALAQGGDDQALRLFDQARSRYQDGVRDSDPKWVWWVDERELAWHEGMLLVDLGRPREAIEKFEQSVATTPPSYARGRYLHLGYLLDAQVKVGAWNDAETTTRQIAPLIGDVASTRGMLLLAQILSELKHEHITGSTREAAEQLTLLLSQATT